jgi:hypothetical protein
MTTLEIAWRNPNAVSARSWRRRFEREREHSLYVLQEFVHDGYIGHWATISNLEVVEGGRAD